MSVAIQFLESVEAGAGISKPVRFSRQAVAYQRPEMSGYQICLASNDNFIISRYSVTVRSHQTRRGIVISFLKFDNRDLSLMVGLASIAGAASGEISKVMFGSPPTNLASLGIVLFAFVAGRYLSGWLRLGRNE